MKLYNSVGPNPHVVRMFMKEKGIEDVELVKVDLRGGENRQEDYMKINPRGQLPALVTNEGLVITEITAICEYLEDIHPENPLVGSTPEEKAETRMWTRRVDLYICEPGGTAFRSAEGYEMFKDRMRVLPDAAADLKEVAKDGLKWLDQQLAGKEFIAGDRLTQADIHLACFLVFMERVGQPLDPALENVGAWFERMKQRPSMAA